MLSTTPRIIKDFLFSSYEFGNEYVLRRKAIERCGTTYVWDLFSQKC